MTEKSRKKALAAKVAVSAGKSGKPTTKPKSAKPAAKAKPAPRLPGADWREETLARMRALIRDADPGMIEERKWRKPSNPAGVAAWSHDGLVATGEIYKQVVKLTFAHGAGLPDPSQLFNSSLEGNTRRAIDIREGEAVDARAFKALVKAAVGRNAALSKK
jgi:hypothetical protein